MLKNRIPKQNRLITRNYLNKSIFSNLFSVLINLSYLSEKIGRAIHMAWINKDVEKYENEWVRWYGIYTLFIHAQKQQMSYRIFSTLERALK